MKTAISGTPSGHPVFRIQFQAGGEPMFKFGDSFCVIQGVEMDVLNWMIAHSVLPDLATEEKERRRLADEEAYMKANAVEIIRGLKAENANLERQLAVLCGSIGDCAKLLK